MTRVRRPTMAGCVATAIGLLLVLLSPAALESPVCAAERGLGRRALIVFIANPALGIAGVTTAELRNLYLGNATTLGGRKVSLFHLSADHPARRLVERAIIGREQEALREHWINLKLQGSDVAEPRVFRSPVALVALVSRDPGAIAYVPLESLGNAAVTVLELDGAAPTTAGGVPSKAYSLVLADER